MMRNVVVICNAEKFLGSSDWEGEGGERSVLFMSILVGYYCYRKVRLLHWRMPYAFYECMSDFHALCTENLSFWLKLFGFAPGCIVFLLYWSMCFDFLVRLLVLSRI